MRRLRAMQRRIFAWRIERYLIFLNGQKKRLMDAWNGVECSTNMGMENCGTAFV
jgi:hypothetical protein